MKGTIAIIPARGGSKRIPKKNIRDFLGKPILAYSIETALRSGLFDVVMVSTDDLETAELAVKYGAKVPFMRSEETSNDFATIADVVLEVLGLYKIKGIVPEIVSCLFATAPLVTVEHLKKAFAKVKNEGFDSAFAIQKFSYPIFRALEFRKDGCLEMFWRENLNKRSQDLPEAYHDAGQFYFAKVDSLIREGTFFLERSTGIKLSNIEAHDIDTEEDWKFLETIYKMKHI